MMSEVEQPQKEKTSSSSQPVSLSSLSDEIIENILARIPNWAYPNLCLVCKRFLSLLSSPQLYMTRFNIGTTEPCLYLCLGSIYDDTPPQWFTLSMKPQETLVAVGEREILNDYSLVPIPSSPHSSPSVSYGASTVAVGSDIYVIGGHVKLSSSVRILYCRSHTWRDAPNMTVARSGAQAIYLDEKIYVMGGCRIDESDTWFEVFDIKTQTWRVLPSPNADHELRKYIVVNPDALERKFYVASGTKDYTYKPEDGTWKVKREESSFREILTSCVIENVMYSCCRSGGLKWYDSEGREWREIKGLEGLRLDMGFIRIVKYGGKLVVMWKEWPGEKFSKNKEVKIGCTKIALEKRHKDEIWGKIEWHNTVLTVPKSYHFFPCVVVSI